MAESILTFKTCFKCQSVKSFDMFPSGRNVCKSCRALQKKQNRLNQSEESKSKTKEKVKEYAQKNKEKISAWKKEYSAKNKKIIAEYQFNYYRLNSEKIKGKAKNWRISNQERKLLANREWANSNKEKALASSRKSKKTSRMNPVIRINNSVSTSIRMAINGKKNRISWQKLVGYTTKELTSHLESKFREGMTFQNYGKVWHIDHIRPVMLFIKEGMDIKKCWALNNLQPLFVDENLRKGAKYNETISENSA